MSHRCLVLMCTYNGEKYLQEQINSIFAQKDVDVELLIADDKSTDNTVDIIKKAIESGQNIKLIENPDNKGYAKNFLDLIVSVKDTDYDYYALSDQDDYWLENKLISAINKIEDYESTHEMKNGTLYFSNSIITDENLNPIKNNNKALKNKKISKYNFLICNYAQGCTMVLTRELMRYFCSQYNCATTIPGYHDWFIALLASVGADFVCDANSYMLYRQHGKNVIGGQGIAISLKQKISTARSHCEEREQFLSWVYSNYKNILTKCALRILKSRIYYRKRLGSKISLIFYWLLLRKSIKAIGCVVLNML